MSVLFKNATVVQFDPPAVGPHTDVLVEDDRIAAVGTVEAPPGTKTIDLAGKILMPGLVCSHHHMYSGLSRGITAQIGPTPDFISILRNLWWRLDRAIDRPSLASSGLVCSMDAIRAGTTAVIDHHASPDFISGSLSVLKEAIEQVGIRGATCYEVTDRHGLKEMEAGVRENVEFAGIIDREKEDGTWSGLTEAHIGAHAPVTLPDDGLRLIADACKETSRGMHVHVAEDRYDVSHSHARHGLDLIARLDGFGLLDERTILVHGVHLSSQEIEVFNERNSFLVHNPRSNMNNSVGYTSRIPEVRNLALGTDGIGADMFEELKAAYFKHKDSGGSWWPGDFLKVLSAGNTMLERIYNDKFGRVESGYKADLVVAAYDPPTPLLPENIAGHMVFGMGSGLVETVMVNGNLVMENREFPFDQEPILEESRRQAAAMWERMDRIKP